jgi:hypothetical protein
VVPNPYTLLALIPAETIYFSCLDSKGAFFCCQLAPVSQPIFAFQWEDLQSGGQQQLTWTCLPQGFKNSPTIFETALISDLQAYPVEKADYTLSSSLQCLTTKTVSYKKLDTKYLKKRIKSVKTKSYIWGFTSPKASENLTEKKKKQTVNPNSNFKGQIHELLKMVGFCQIWIPNFSLLAKPLYKATQGDERESLIWKSKQQQAFCAIKETLVSAPALGLPDVKSLSSSMCMRETT